MECEPSLQSRIVFGDDHSAGADIAFRWITAHEWPTWDLDIVSVTPPDPSFVSLITSDPLREVQPEHPRTIPKSCELKKVRYLTASGDPRIVLSEGLGVGLTVIGARGSGIMKALHLGSTAERLAKSPNAPVVIARRSERIHSILACVDGSPHSDAAIAALVKMPWIATTHVTVLAVDHDLDWDSEVPSLREKAENSARILRDCGAKVSVKVLLADPTVSRLNAKYPIFDMLDSLAPDFVALGTKGRRGLSRALMGSIANDVTQYAECSVLLAHGH
ncbi:MAG: universal stress protein [Candidatus Nanopelagicales bacterium]|nr:universal stress protein [Candidatus Nanopelagicales bacterium]